MNLDDLGFDKARLDEVCARFGVRRLEVFGSFSRGEAGPDSDVDILVTLEPGSLMGLKFVQFQQELESIFGRHVDLLTRVSVENSRNKYFRSFVLRHTEPIFEHA